MMPGRRIDSARHIVLVTANPAATGGMQTFTRYLTRTLRDGGWRVTLAISGENIYSHDAALQEESPRIENVNWIDESLGGDREYRLCRIARRRRWFRQHRPDVALFVQSSNTPYRASVAGAWLAGIPVVVTHRTLPWPIDDVGSRRHCFGLLPGLGLYRRRSVFRTRLTAHLAQRVVFNSEAVRTAYEAFYGYPPRKARVIPNAVAEITGSPTRRERASRASWVVGYVGRLGKEKRVDLLIRAVAESKGEADLRVVIYGDGPERDALQDLAAELGIADRVAFKGITTQTASVWRALDLFVMPSDRESSSNAVLEAQAAGVPVIVSGVGGLPELVDHGQAGAIFPSGDARALAEAISTLIRHPERSRQLAVAGHARAMHFHAADVVSRQWLTLLDDVCTRRRPQSPRVVSDSMSKAAMPRDGLPISAGGDA